MPLFGNQQQNQGTAVWGPQAADAAAQTGRVRRGVFTSDLSVSEYARRGPVEPLGASAPPSSTAASAAGLRPSADLTQAMYNAREWPCRPDAPRADAARAPASRST